MKRVAGTVILYHPRQEELKRHLQSYLPEVDLLIVIDNTEQEQPGIVEMLNQLSHKILYQANHANRGVASALNIAARFAFDKGFQWLITMDQDSFFERKEIEQYFSNFLQSFYEKNDVAVIAPAHGEEHAAGAVQFSNVASVITSGSILHLGIWNKIGGFDEKLFIDEVDHEYCYRARAKGFSIVRFNNVFLQHALGTKRKAGYLGVFGVRERRIHNPARVYYMVRNYLYVRQNYRKVEKEEFRSRDSQLRTMLKNNLFFSGKFGAVLYNIIKGYIDFKKKRFGAKM